MYIPASFSEEDPRVLADFMRAHSFATLVSQVESVPFATHLPLHYDETNRSLWGHMAKANTQWRSLEGAEDVLVIFPGPHAYISPRYYADDTAVPSWNYATVHVYGKVVLVEDIAEQKQMLQKLTAVYEEPRPQPWEPNWEDRNHADKLAAITFFRIEIKQIEGKFKLSQNRPHADQQGAIEALRKVDTDDARGIAALMQERLNNLD
ncbi:MAG: transcriptional regulator [Candidatus Latescibacterota bacterium]|jgi:transcriptional regulator